MGHKFSVGAPEAIRDYPLSQTGGSNGTNKCQQDVRRTFVSATTNTSLDYLL